MSAINPSIDNPNRTVFDRICALTPTRKSRRKASTQAKRGRRNLQFEGLEKRELFAVSNVAFGGVAGDVLIVQADSATTVATASKTGSKIRIDDLGAKRAWDVSKFDADTMRITEVGTNNVRYFDSTGIGRIEFQGGSNNDSFESKVANVPVTAFGFGGNDVLKGNSGNDTLIGGIGNDKLYGGDGIDTLWGEGGNDFLSGAAGKDFLYGGIGDDTLYGGAERDEMYGQAGDDNLYGGTGNDHLDGGADNDGLFGGVRDEDKLIGGSGADRFLQPENMEMKHEYYYKSWWQELIGHKSLRTVWKSVAEDTISDFNGKDDAVVKFKSLDNPTIGSEAFTKQYWTNADIERVDKALEKLHDLTRNTKLLETASGGAVTIGRVGSQTTLLPNKSDWVPGWFNGKDLIAVTEEAFARSWEDDMVAWGFDRL